MRKTYAQFLFAALIGLAVLSSNSIAQTRIKFRKGSYSTTFSGRLGANQQQSFVIAGRAGQSMTITVRSSNRRVKAYTEETGEHGGALVQAQFSRTGDMAIDLSNEGSNAASYTITIVIR